MTPHAGGTPLRVALIGYGAWGRQHAAAIARTPGAQLSAIACQSEESAEAARRDHPLARVSRNYRDVLERSDVDAVDVVVPNDLHAEIAEAALARGKDVLLEKPMATTLADCDRLIAAARRHGRVLSIGHELRLSRQWGRVKALIDEGEIGEPRYAHVSLFRFPYRRGARGWRYDADRVGSWALEELVHHFDLLLWYFARWGDPVSVLAVGDTSRGDVRMCDSFTSVIRFPGSRHAVLTQTVAAFEYHLALEIAGSDGAIRSWWSGRLDRTREARYELALARRGEAASRVLPIEASGELFELEEEIAQTVAAFAERRALVTGEEARKSVALCLGAERSLREGREIPLG